MSADEFIKTLQGTLLSQRQSAAISNLDAAIKDKEKFKAVPSSQYPMRFAGDAKMDFYPGYLQGSQPPAALKYVTDFFGEGAEQVPLTRESYNQFNAIMFKAFRDGGLKGSVSYEPPSYEDVKRVLESDPNYALKSIDWSRNAAPSSVENPKRGLAGLPNSKFTKEDALKSQLVQAATQSKTKTQSGLSQ